VIKAQNVTKIFPGRLGPIRAVDGVSTEVARGEVVVIIGPSGSGKSTFLRCINGLETFRRSVLSMCPRWATPVIPMPMTRAVWPWKPWTA
jgi:ABC-type polar amino acid transport system ATPase subunit